MSIQRPFYNRIGGKYRLLKKILSLISPGEKYDQALFTKKYDYYIEPFFGAGWLYFNFYNAKNFIINDNDSAIYKMLQAIKEGKYSKIASFDWSPSEKTFYELKKIFIDKPKFSKLDNYETLYIYRYLNYFGVIGGWHTFNRNRNRGNIIAMERFIKNHQKLNDHTHIFNCDYQNIVKKYDSENSFLFLDPPYVNTSGFDKYECPRISMDEFIEICTSLKGDALITLSARSIKDEEINKLKKSGFIEENVKVLYSTGNFTIAGDKKKEEIIFKKIKNF